MPLAAKRTEKEGSRLRFGGEEVMWVVGERGFRVEDSGLRRRRIQG